jgi:hypothetical protein
MVLLRSLRIAGRDAKVDWMFLHIVTGENDDIGQFFESAGMPGVVPP